GAEDWEGGSDWEGPRAVYPARQDAGGKPAPQAGAPEGASAPGGADEPPELAGAFPVGEPDPGSEGEAAGQSGAFPPGARVPDIGGGPGERGGSAAGARGAPRGAAASGAGTAGSGDPWSVAASAISADAHEELAGRIGEFLSLSSRITEGSRELSALVVSTSDELGLLLREYLRPEVSPHVQEDILSQLKGIRAVLADETASMDSEADALAPRAAELKALYAGALRSGGPRPEGWRSVQTEFLRAEYYYRWLSEEIPAATGEAKTLLDRLDGFIVRYSAEIPAAWKAYYLSESRLTSLKLPEFSGDRGYFNDWFRQMMAKKKFLYPQTSKDWVECAPFFFMILGIAALIGALLSEWAKKLAAMDRQSGGEEEGEVWKPNWPMSKILGLLGLLSRILVGKSNERREEHKGDGNWSRWHKALLELVNGPILLLIFGLAFYFASNNHHGGNYLLFFLPGVLSLIWGIAAASWKLRQAVKPELDKVKSPLRQFYLPGLLGGVFLFADMPTGMLTLLWFTILAFFLIRLVRISRLKDEGSEIYGRKGFLLENFAYESAKYFAILSLLITVAGYPRLAVLAFMLLFTFVNVLLLGNVFVEFGSDVCKRIFDENDHPVKYSLLDAFLQPITWSASLFCTIPWLIAIPGMMSLLMNLLTMGYSVGEASFDLTKVLLSVALFFVFKTLMKLGKTSIDNLPEEIRPDKAKNALIQTIITYIIWIMFAVVAMGLLGVNWTSLAVAASGLGLGLGIGLQNIFNNMVSGIILIFGRSVKVGDFVEVDGTSGIVKRVDFRCTVVETLDDSLVYVPNSTIVSAKLVNWTGDVQSTLMRTLVIRVFYGTPIEDALRLIKEVSTGYRLPVGDLWKGKVPDAGESNAPPQDAGEGKAAPQDAGEGKAAPQDAGEGKAAPQDAGEGKAAPQD
ncbi:MAG: mechanosensitive ion channel family protein, partial [Deltaproteobacteria bacterium]|nr:mechanosensitive ion channel family protein [Deltaproteobacteria bacterium]